MRSLSLRAVIVLCFFQTVVICAVLQRRDWAPWLRELLIWRDCLQYCLSKGLSAVEGSGDYDTFTSKLTSFQVIDPEHLKGLHAAGYGT